METFMERNQVHPLLTSSVSQIKLINYSGTDLQKTKEEIRTEINSEI